MFGAMASETAPGWTHVWDGETQLALSEGQAATLVAVGYIEYSPEDGPFARVYRPLAGKTNVELARMLT